ncbi:Sec-independent protein translocase protein TatB [Lysobacter sp. KIS68-7]|uniref:Sec-independent protein translocase protein TatB n=1 Tax=Lysobacter sp. KIS68-7 TaxID=2904252 RepID=UPI001E450CEA|nr:Sec-independent protein translocase protein TatB [Lysobacter sp. KIS68-7]UHQ20405.1 Sec-independent protein translocase protein TatB [Lysobacter sp. KIS68-7]
MFDIGFSELLVIAVVALIVLGPERLPKAARFAGLWVRKARAQWYAVKSEFERDLAAEELQRSLRETRESLRQAEEQLRGGAAAFQQRLEQGFDEVKTAATALPAAAESQASEAQGEANADKAPAFAEEEERPMGSTLEIDDIGPPPADEDDDGFDVDVVHDEHEDAPHPRKPADDAHAGR